MTCKGKDREREGLLINSTMLIGRITHLKNLDISGQSSSQLDDFVGAMKAYDCSAHV